MNTPDNQGNRVDKLQPIEIVKGSAVKEMEKQLTLLDQVLGETLERLKNTNLFDKVSLEKLRELVNKGELNKPALVKDVLKSQLGQNEDTGIRDTKS